MYAYRPGLRDEELYSKEGQVVAGAAIGIILFGQAGYALPPGSVENATTFRYPVLYTSIPAASVENVVSEQPHPEVLAQLIEAGRYLERQGCRAIVGACGYFANYLPQVTRELNTPCFFSSLMQVPLILSSLGPEKKIGILCADGRVLKTAPVLRNCGVEDTSRLVIAGAEILPEMEKILNGVGHYNAFKLEQGLVGLAKGMVSREPEIGAFVLECSLFPAHAWAVQEAVKLPIYDFSTLVDWAYSAAVRRPFGGYL